MRPSNPSLDRKYFAGLDPKQKLIHFIKFAALAPSSHNTQPWLFRVFEGGVDVLFDSKRALAVSDPTGREMYISIGAAIENFTVAARHFGFQCEVQPIFQGNHVAKILAQPNAGAFQKEDFAKTMLARHNNRFEYEDRRPDPEFLRWLDGQSGPITVHVFEAQGAKDRIAEIIGGALVKALDDHNFRQELSHWIKPSLQKYSDGMPGYNLGMPAPVAFVFPFMIRRIKAGKMQRSMEMKSLKKTPAYVVLSSKQDDQAAWLETGRLFERIALHAEAANLKIGVLAAAIEMQPFNDQLKEFLQTGERPQMFFRLGYTDKIPKQSPRLDPKNIIIG